MPRRPGAKCLPLRSLNHISRVSKDIGKAVEFYTSVLGFVEIKRPDSFDFEGSWLFNYGIGIHLIQGEPVKRPTNIDPKGDHLSFQSDNLAEVEDRLADLGIPCIKATVEEAGMRVTQIFFHDTDANMIEICNCDCLPIQPLAAKSFADFAPAPSGQWGNAPVVRRDAAKCAGAAGCLGADRASRTLST